MKTTSKQFKQRVYRLEGELFFGDEVAWWEGLQPVRKFVRRLYRELAVKTPIPSIGWLLPKDQGRIWGCYDKVPHSVRFTKRRDERIRENLILHELSHALHHSIDPPRSRALSWGIGHGPRYLRILFELQVRYGPWPNLLETLMEAAEDAGVWACPDPILVWK